MLNWIHYKKERKKNMKKCIHILGLAILFMLGINCFSSDVYAETYKNYEYEVLGNGTVKITGYYGNAKKLTIPKKIKGKQVTVIGRFCFLGASSVKTLVLPEGVQTLESLSIYDMSNLKDITIPQTVTAMTDCGIGWYSEASEHPRMTIRVVKGTKAFKYVTKNHSSSNIKVSKKTKATVKFNLMGGECKTINKCVKKNSKLGTLPKPTKEGYVFKGWYTKSKDGKKISTKTKIKSTKDITYYARWEKVVEVEENSTITN